MKKEICYSELVRKMVKRGKKFETCREETGYGEQLMLPGFFIVKRSEVKL